MSQAERLVSLEEIVVSDQGAAQGAALLQADADVAELVRCWPDLSPAVKAGILALVRASVPGP